MTVQPSFLLTTSLFYVSELNLGWGALRGMGALKSACEPGSLTRESLVPGARAAHRPWPWPQPIRISQGGPEEQPQPGRGGAADAGDPSQAHCCKSQQCHLAAVWPWESHPASLSSGDRRGVGHGSTTHYPHAGQVASAQARPLLKRSSRKKICGSFQLGVLLSFVLTPKPGFPSQRQAPAVCQACVDSPRHRPMHPPPARPVNRGPR